MFHIDVLHCFDLGLSEHVFGNLFNDICSGELDLTKPKALAELNKRIHTIYWEMNAPAATRIPYLSYNHFSKTNCPRLKFVKGSRVRTFAPIAEQLAMQFVSD